MSSQGQRNYRNLAAWQRSHEVTLAVYKETGRFPSSELYGLTSQLRRAAFSMGANIAEGCGRQNDKEFLQFLHISLGSMKEVEYGLLVARDLSYLNPKSYEQISSTLNQAFAALQGLIRSIRQRVTGP